MPELFRKAQTFCGSTTKVLDVINTNEELKARGGNPIASRLVMMEL
jgi:hypothetical protein